jgi:hypothetical protein
MPTRCSLQWQVQFSKNMPDHDFPQAWRASRRRRSSFSPTLFSPQSVKLSVPKGTPLQIPLLLVEPVYAFDRMVVPVGSQVTGQVTKIETLSGGKRTIASLDGDFTPERKVEVSVAKASSLNGRPCQGTQIRGIDYCTFLECKCRIATLPGTGFAVLSRGGDAADRR